MYIKNNSPIIETILPIRNRFIPGNVFSGKLTSLEGNKGTIKLFDGTIIPVILHNENNIDKNRIIRFRVEGVEDNLLILRTLNIPAETHTLEYSTTNIFLKDLGLPSDIGAEIIDSLIRFNLPANTENILKIYNNHILLNVIRNYTDEDILKLLKKYILKDAELTEAHQSAAKDILNTLKSIDINFLSFLMENDIPQDIDSMIKTSRFIKDNYQEKLLELLNNLFSLMGNGDSCENRTTTSDNTKNGNMLNIISTLKDKIAHEDLKNIMDRLDILKHLRDNYNIYNFNTEYLDKKYGSTIIIKNTVRRSQSINFNDLKAFMSIKTPAIGVVNCYIVKNMNNLFINLGVEKEYVKVFTQNSEALKSLLKENNLNLNSFSVKEQLTPESLINLSLFFNSYTPVELDVRI